MINVGDGFHAHDGWYFQRGDNGAVTVTNVKHANCTVTVDANTWASIVASVSVSGETSNTFYAALTLHAGVAEDSA